MYKSSSGGRNVTSLDDDCRGTQARTKPLRVIDEHSTETPPQLIIIIVMMIMIIMIMRDAHLRADAL